MVKAVKLYVGFRFSILVILPFISLSSLQAQNNPLDRRISVTFIKLSLEESLNQIATHAKCSFAYNSGILPADSVITYTVDNEEVSVILTAILGEQIAVAATGSHIILKKTKHTKKALKAIKKEVKQSKTEPINEVYNITGYIVNAKTGDKIVNATIHEVDDVNAVLTDFAGFYSLDVSNRTEPLTISFSRKNYLDTVIIIEPMKSHNIDIRLSPKVKPVDKMSTLIADSVPSIPRREINNLKVVRVLVPEEQMKQMDNLSLYETLPWQVSILPYIGTNKTISGVVSNHLSLNLLAGYSAGVNGVEVGGLLNISRQNADGLQVAGFGNVVGGNARGIQTAGFFNHVLGSVIGLQVSGFSNIVTDTLYGIQISGFNNIIRGSLYGGQFSGFSNVAIKNVEGMQVSGILNICFHDVRALQASGGINIANDVSALQAAGVANYASGEVSGLQVAGLLNVARSVKGMQIGLFNFSDSITGLPIGLFSFSLHGYHEFDVAYDELGIGRIRFKTGASAFYNILEYSNSFFDDRGIQSVGYGLGTSTNIGKVVMHFDVVGAHLVQHKAWGKNLNVMGRADIGCGIRIGEKVVIFGGPSLVYYMTYLNSGEQLLLENDRISGQLVFDNVWDGLSHKAWLGWQVGIRF